MHSDRVGIAEAASAWQTELEGGGYEHHANSDHDLRRLYKLSRSLRLALRATGVRPTARVLEVGCGGGAQLVPLALNGFECTGVDCSPAVLERFHAFAAEV